MKRHQCGTIECPSCKQYCNLYTHKCFIQNPGDLKKKIKNTNKNKRKRKSDGGLVSHKEKEHIFVYWDCETMQNTGVHIPNLVSAATSDTGELYLFEGEDSIKSFIELLMNSLWIVRSLSSLTIPKDLIHTSS